MKVGRKQKKRRKEILSRRKNSSHRIKVYKETLKKFNFAN